MNRSAFADYSIPLRMTLAELLAIPEGRPEMLSDQPPGTRWQDRCRMTRQIRVRTYLGPQHDGCRVVTYRPVIRVQAVSRLVPRPESRA